ncbi:MAG: hypothetical protein ACREO1_04910 [Arenimonas sp.]
MKPFTTIASALFAIIAFVHLIRFIQAWPVSVNGMVIPVWASAVAFAFTLMLSIMLWRESRR